MGFKQNKNHNTIVSLSIAFRNNSQFNAILCNNCHFSFHFANLFVLLIDNNIHSTTNEHNK